MYFLKQYTVAIAIALSATISRGFTIKSLNSISRAKQTKTTHLFNNKDDSMENISIFSRRNFLISTGATVAAVSNLSFPSVSQATDYSGKKVLVLGGTGFVGSEVCKKLKSLGIEVISTSRNGRDGTKALDFTAPGINVADEVEKLAGGCLAVISCVGVISTPDDGAVNSASGNAALGAKAAGVKNFVYISVAPEVREIANGVTFLDAYMEGKAFSENLIMSKFGVDGCSYTIIEPTFIYGGDKFGINPPRVADGYGKLVEGLLSSSPFRFAADVTPGLISVALKPPVKVGAVSGAAVAGALGLSQHVLDTYDEINAAASLV